MVGAEAAFLEYGAGHVRYDCEVGVSSQRLGDCIPLIISNTGL